MITREELRNNRLFREFDEHELDMVRLVAEEINFEDGDLILVEGEPGKRLYMIVSGRCSVTTQISGTGTEEIKLLEANEFFGEMSLIEAAPISASVYARGKCRLLWIDRKALDRLLDEDMPIANKLLKEIIMAFCERVRDTMEKMQSYYKMSKF